MSVNWNVLFPDGPTIEDMESFFVKHIPLICNGNFGIKLRHGLGVDGCTLLYYMLQPANALICGCVVKDFDNHQELRWEPLLDIVDRTRHQVHETLFGDAPKAVAADGQEFTLSVWLNSFSMLSR